MLSQTNETFCEQLNVARLYVEPATSAASAHAILHFTCAIDLELFGNPILIVFRAISASINESKNILIENNAMKPPPVGVGCPPRGCIHPLTTRCQVQARALGVRRAGPSTPKPDYAALDDQPLNKLVYSLFRAKMVNALGGKDSSMEGYDGIIELTRRLNSVGTPLLTQQKTREILLSLFPSWLPPAFKVRT